MFLAISGSMPAFVNARWMVCWLRDASLSGFFPLWCAFPMFFALDGRRKTENGKIAELETTIGSLNDVLQVTLLYVVRWQGE